MRPGLALSFIGAVKCGTPPPAWGSQRGRQGGRAPRQKCLSTKEELLRNVWGFRSLGTTRTLDSHACRLRFKLGIHGGKYVINVWGVGYRLIDGPVGP